METNVLIGSSVVNIACIPIVCNQLELPLLTTPGPSLVKTEVLESGPSESSTTISPESSQPSLASVKCEGLNVSNLIEEPLLNLVHQSSTTMIKKENSSEFSFLCNHCGEVFADLSSFAQHVCILTGDQALNTPASDLFESRPSSGETSILHMDNVLKPEPAESSETVNPIPEPTISPPTVCSSSTSLTSDRPYVCSLCDKSYTSASSLLIHERRHAGERPYVCRFCSKSFPDSSSCSRHQRIHTGERPYVCEICQRAFNDSSHLVTHRRKHTGERPYSCSQCPKAFFKSSDLKRHLRTHLSERPLACEICDKRFKDAGALQKHRRTHLASRPFECEECDKSFFDRSSYLRHTRIHSGDRSWSCDVCGKGFFDSANLKRHARTHLSPSSAADVQVQESVS